MCTHAGYPECTITNEGSMTFSHEAFQNKTVTAEQLLRGLAAKDTKVVYLLTGIAEMRDLFAAVYRTKLLYGTGYAWFVGWLTSSMFYNDDKTFNNDTARGAEGVMGFAPPDAAEYAAATPASRMYQDLYATRSSKTGCTRETNATWWRVTAPFCDGDGDPMHYPVFSTEGIDAVITFAVATHSLLSGARPVVHALSSNHNSISALTPAAIYDEMLKVRPFDGVGAKGTAPLCCWKYVLACCTDPSATLVVPVELLYGVPCEHL